MELITNVEFVHCSPLAPFMSNTPLDATKAWSVWEEEQKRILMSVTLGAMGDGKTMHRIYHSAPPPTATSASPKSKQSSKNTARNSLGRLYKTRNKMKKYIGTKVVTATPAIRKGGKVYLPDRRDTQINGAG